MPVTEHEHLTGDLIAPDIDQMLDAHENQAARQALAELLPVEVADVLLALEPRHHAVAFRLLPRDKAAEVFTFLPEDKQEELLGELSSEQLAHLFNEMAPDDRTELFEEMPGQLAARVLALLRPEERRQAQVILGYPPESIGRLMTPDYITIAPDWTVQQVIEHIRKHGLDAETINFLYVIDPQGHLLDDIRLRQILLADGQAEVRSLMDEQFTSLQAFDDREEAVRLMERYDRASLPVVDRQGVLVGIVTFDDVADVATEETTEDIQKMGGVEALDMPYMSISLWQLVRKRGVWLSMLFLGEMLTATAMGHYEAEMHKVTVLALFVPLIISSGGNSGSQASTLIIRAMALGEVKLRQWWWVFRRELAAGLLLGILLGTIGLARITVWQWAGIQDYTVRVGDASVSYHMLALSVGVSLIGVVLWGSLMGSMLPFLLRLLRLDPATISAPLVATLVDVTGLIIYFSTALIFLHGVLG